MASVEDKDKKLDTADVTVGLIDKQNVKTSRGKIPFPSCRLVVAIMAFLAMINLYCMRVNLSVAIVVMANSTYASSSDVKSNHSEPAEPPCEGGNVTYKSSMPDGEFLWSTSLQSYILGAFFYGYICTQFFGGIMAQKFGSKRLLMLALGMNSILCMLTPVLTKLGDAPMLITIRILQGVFQGISFPCTHGLISKWAPPLERSKLITFAYAGCQLGTVIANPVCGFLGAYSWEAIFYLFGGVSMAFTICWFFVIYDDPSIHPRISPSEKEYIISELGGVKPRKIKLKELPWCKIITSVPLYATTVAHFANNWGFYTMLTVLPTFFSKVLNFDIKSNGAIAALPYLASWTLMIFAGWMADLLITKKVLSVTKVRKLANIVGLMGPAVFFVATGYIDCNNALAVFCIVAGVGLSGVSWAGWSVNHLDLAPLYAGTLMGLTNTFATIPGFAGPALAGVFTSHAHTRANWRKVFYVAAAISAFGAIFFCIFGSGEKQSWGVEQKKDEQEMKEEEAKEKKEEVVKENP